MNRLVHAPRDRAARSAAPEPYATRAPQHDASGWRVAEASVTVPGDVHVADPPARGVAVTMADNGTTRAASAIASPPDASAVRRRVGRVRDGRIELTEDWIAAEVPVALLYNDTPHVVMMASPGDFEDFVLGFSLSEGIVDSPGELSGVRVETLLEGIEVRGTIPAARAEAVALRQRNLTGRSSCGLCGTQELEHVVRHPAPVGEGPRIDRAILQRALSALRAAQPVAAMTGATHAAAWADASGELVLVREDVGRHNALDKLIGAMARAGTDVDQGFAVVTSRASYEMVQKAATVGITLLAAISAPTALAMHLAESTGVTLIGFARDDGHVVYAHPQRLTELRS